MKNKKGFTLIELMGVIIIIGVIALIAFSSFVGISRRMKEQAYKNKVKLIETKAENYANETGFLDTNVATLVDKGFLEADNNKDEVLSPIDKSLMNCHMVKMENNDGVYYAEYQEEEACDLSGLIRNADGLVLNATKVDSNTPYVGGEWTKENVELSLSFSKDIDVNNIDNIIWTIDGYEDEVLVNGNFNDVNKYNVETFVVFNSNVSVEVMTRDKVLYKANIDVKIDKENPVSYQDDIKIDKKDEFTRNNKKVTITATDNEGSGINGYYIGTNSNCTSNPYTKTSNTTFEIDQFNGTYYVCVKDNVGNISDRISYTISKVDQIAPKCKLIADRNGIRVEATDDSDSDQSGVNFYDLSDSSINAGYKYAYVYDNVGNEGSCGIDISDYVDKGYNTTTYVCDAYLSDYRIELQTCESYVNSTTVTTRTCKKQTSADCFKYNVTCKRTTKSPTVTYKTSCSACGCSSYSGWKRATCYGDLGGCNVWGKANHPGNYRCVSEVGCQNQGMGEYRTCSSCGKCAAAGSTKSCPSGYVLESDGLCAKYTIKESDTANSVSKCPSGSVTNPICGYNNVGTQIVCDCEPSSDYNWKDEKTTSTNRHCIVGTKFTCNEDNVGRSYISKCTPNYDYRFSSKQTIYSGVLRYSTTYSCSSEYDEGKEKVDSFSAIYQYYFKETHGWSAYEYYSPSFTCSPNTRGQTYTNFNKLPKDCPDNYNRISGTEKCYK